MSNDQSLGELRAEFSQGRFLAMPIAGTLAWSVAGILGAILPVYSASIALFLCTGFIFPLGLLIALLTSEDLLGTKSNNALDRLRVGNPHGQSCLGDWYAVLHDLTIITPSERWYLFRSYVDSILLDDSALDWHVPRHRTHSSCRCSMALVPWHSVCTDSYTDRDHLLNFNLCAY